MKAYVISVTISLLLAASCAAKAPTTKPARTTTQPATATAPAVDPAVRKILDAMETAGKTTKSVRADFTYKTVNLTLGDEEFRTGWVAYQRGQTIKSGGKVAMTIPPRFRVHFETMRLGRGKTVTMKVDYIFDGKNFIIARAKNKNIIRMQVPPNMQGANMLALGKGPMPIPFGQKAADMITHFVCTTRPKRFNDPKETVYLNLVPRKAHAKKLNSAYIHMWASTKHHLPIKIVSKDKSKNLITTSFTNMKINKDVKKSLFRFPKPFGWKLIVQPFKAGQNIKP
jgi:outer membrane lipoprotein-sorting protein